MIEQALSLRAAAGLAALLALAPLAAAQKAAKPDTPEALIARWFAADARTPAGAQERAQLEAQLDMTLGVLGPSEVKDWSAKILARAAQGGKLEKSAGEHSLDAKLQRGHYALAGELKKPRGLYVCLHDADRNDGGSVGASRAATGISAYLSNLKWLGLFPQAPTLDARCWNDPVAQELVVELIGDALRTWDIDRDHVAIGGFFEGSRGAWMVAAHHADLFSALYSSSGGPLTVGGSAEKPEAIVPGVIPNLRNVPVFALAITDDPKLASPAAVLALAALDDARQKWGGYELRSEGVTLVHDEPKGGRQAWYESLAKKARDARPARLLWQPTALAPQQFGWLCWDAPVADALVQADIEPNSNRVKLACSADLAGLSVLLDARLVNLAKPVVIEVNGKESFRGVPEARLSTLLRTGARGDPELQFACRVPVVGAPGGPR